jgi:hypothetical protein
LLGAIAGWKYMRIPRAVGHRFQFLSESVPA